MSEAWWIGLAGPVVQTIIFLGGGVVMVVRHDGALKAFQMEMSKMQLELRALAQVITKQAVQDERLNDQSRRMNNLEQRIEDLRRGRGYVQERDVATVDREY